MSSIEGLLLTLMAALAGSMLFFAITVAPTVFRSLPSEQAGAFLRALFPRYYLWGLVVALLCALVAPLAEGATIPTVVCGLITLLFVYARQFLLPAINRARDLDLDDDQQARRRFRALHLQSVLINALQLLLLIAASGYLIWV